MSRWGARRERRRAREPRVSPRVRYLLTVVGVVVLALVVVAPPERCPSVSTDELEASATEAVDWFVRNQAPDGSWLYLYESDTGTVVDDYNVVRHAGAIMGLYQAATAEIPGAQESADDGVDWIEERLLRRDDWAAVRYQGQTPVGATALLVAGLAERREATGDDRYDDLLGELGRFLEGQVEPSGAVLAYANSNTGEPIAGLYSKYYTGEAWWALARLHQEFPGDGWDRPAALISTYVATERDEVEDYWPPLPDHWAAYGLDSAPGPLSDAEVGYARRQAELFGSQVRWLSQRFGPWGLLVRGPHEPRGGGYGVVGEALTGLWRVAQDDDRLADMREPLAERAQCVAGLAIDAQTRSGDDRVRGAWFRDGSTRMDDQQHAISALLRTVPIVEAAEDGSGSGSGPDAPRPSLWLWAVVFLAAVNPVRLAIDILRRRASPPAPAPAPAAAGRPAEPSSPSGPVAATDAAVPDAAEVVSRATSATAEVVSRATSATAEVVSRATSATAEVDGGLRRAELNGLSLGARLVFLVALVSIPLVDAMNVSDPALRIAAGAVAAAVGISELAGRWSELDLPLAFASPAVIILGISARTDVGVLGLVGLLLAGLALVAVAVATLPRTPRGARVAIWLGRVTAAAMAVTSILLVVDGIFAV